MVQDDDKKSCPYLNIMFKPCIHLQLSSPSEAIELIFCTGVAGVEEER